MEPKRRRLRHGIPRGLVAVLHALPPWGRVVFLVALLAAAVACRMDIAFAEWF